MAQKLKLPDGPVYDSSGNIVGFGKQRYNQPVDHTIQQVMKQNASYQQMTPPLQGVKGSDLPLNNTLFARFNNPAPDKKTHQQQEQHFNDMAQVEDSIMRNQGVKIPEENAPQRGIIVKNTQQAGATFPKWEPFPENNTQGWIDLLFKKPDTSGVEKFGSSVGEVLKRLIFGQPEAQTAPPVFQQVAGTKQINPTTTLTPIITPPPAPGGWINPNVTPEQRTVIENRMAEEDAIIKSIIPPIPAPTPVPTPVPTEVIPDKNVESALNNIILPITRQYGIHDKMAAGQFAKEGRFKGIGAIFNNPFNIGITDWMVQNNDYTNAPKYASLEDGVRAYANFVTGRAATSMYGNGFEGKNGKLGRKEFAQAFAKYQQDPIGFLEAIGPTYASTGKEYLKGIMETPEFRKYNF